VPLLPLPIDEVLPELLAKLRAAGSVALRAPTGAGKTTRVPPALLDAQLAGGRWIVVLQPRRLAARACAARMAFERQQALGDEVGYQVRFDRRVGPRTRIHVVTEGILLRMLHDDPFLEQVGLVVFDEFHQRSLSSDLALAMARRVRDTVRPDLKLVVMSATLQPQPVAEYLGGCPIVESHGRLHPVAIEYREDVEHRPLPDRVAEAVQQIVAATTGDTLVFLPGVGEIHRTARRLEALAAQHDLAVLPLYGDLPPEQQDRVLAPQPQRKVVLATNVAETSITIDGITAVVDSGLARTLTYDPHVGLDRLHLARISRASADQRAGRAGRTRPGRCLRLWAERTHAQRPDHDEPEIHRLDLAGPVLQLRAWGEADLSSFPWYEPPDAQRLAQADALLRRLDALDVADRVTETGQAMVRLPASPRLARMLLEGHRRGAVHSVALAAALLAERDPWSRSEDERGRHESRRAPSSSDVLDRVAALDAFQRDQRRDTPLGPINAAAAKFILHARTQLAREVRQVCGPSPTQAADEDAALLRSLLTAFPDRLARRSHGASHFGRMVGGRGVRLAPTSAVRDAPLFLAVEVDRGESEALVRQASAVERDWLPAEHLSLRTEVEFDPATRRVIARRRLYWEDLLLEETPAALPADDQAATVLAAAAADALDQVFPWDDSATGEYLARVRCLAQWLPELELPALDEAFLRAMLPQVAHGARSFDDLKKGPWLSVLEAQLTPQQRQAVLRETPDRITVPSGSRIKLQYEPGKPPVLAVRIQEIFGMLETPRVARGRVRVLLHLLAPNLRPQQVTDDLASFWQNTYQQVRKDLRRRYPKHSWPEDPYQATAQRRPQRK